jgi:tetratricopeptide (TPR) repeat protein
MNDKHYDVPDETGGMPPDNQAEAKQVDAEEFFSAGLFLLKSQRLKEAHQAFRRAFEMKGSDPRYMSFYGYTLAKVGGRVKDGLLLCEKAAEKEFYRAELFYNLSQVYLEVGNRKKAYETLRRGLAIDRGNKELVRELEKMGIRKPPVFPFLDRSNTINKLAGKALYKLRLRR